MVSIAVVDDQELLRDSLAQTLQRAGYHVRTYGNGETALDDLRQRPVNLVVSDLKMPGLDGVELLRRLRASGADLPVILMTAYGTISSAIEAMKLGAYDYIQKPFEADEIELLVSRAIRDAELRAENEALRRTVTDWYRGRELVGRSAGLRFIREQVARIAVSDATVLIEGESGTGKEMVARAIHAASSRSKRPMLCLNCAALSASLLESELFGHEKGAFTGADKLRKGRFELADGGTLLLDEVSEIPLTLQAKLLRVLQEKQFERVGSSITRDVDVRVIATTNRNLRKWIEQKKFREDLYYRLSVLPIYIPPLRERRDDILPLAEHFLDRLAETYRRPRKTISGETAELLERYDWPGNVRELENLMERAWVLADGDEIPTDLIRPWLVSRRTAEPASSGQRAAGKLEDMERELVLRTLAEFDGHRARTARALGIGLRTLGLKLKRWQEQGVEVPGGAGFAPRAQLVP